MLGLRCESVNIFRILAQEIQREIAEDAEKEAAAFPARGFGRPLQREIVEDEKKLSRAWSVTKPSRTEPICAFRRCSETKQRTRFGVWDFKFGVLSSGFEVRIR